MLDMADCVVRLSDGRAVSPSLVSGPLATYAPAFAAKDSRIFAPCGSSVFCYSVKTTKHIGTLEPHRGQVTAVCSSVPQPKGTSVIAAGTSLGEVRLWDAKACTCLASLDFGGVPVLALRWPREDTLLVALGHAELYVRVEKVQVLAPSAPRREGELPISGDHVSAFEAAGDAVAIIDDKVLHVWMQGWVSSRTFVHKSPLTALSVDPQQRYVVTGDEKGVVWTWWGILGSDESANRVPARWHWHAQPVRALTHCGPLLLSGGEEAVLCIRNPEDDTTRFVPRFPGAIRHLAASGNGQYVCASLAQNSLTIISDLHGQALASARYIHALDVPSSASSSQAKAPGILQSLDHGGFAVIGSNRRIQFLDETGSSILPQTLALDKGPGTRSAGTAPTQRWALNQVAVGAGGSCIMTCESRISPALERFDKESAKSYVLKWWRRGDDGQFSLDSVSHDPHSADVTVLLAHPRREHLFVTGSLDGTFKSWDWLPVNGGAGADGNASGRCWQCVLLGAWHARPITAGCLGADGSALVLGFSGFIVLWETETANELQSVALPDEADEILQLFSVMACGRFLLLASVCGADKRDAIMCWDLASLEVVIRIDLASALGGAGRALVRLATPTYAGGSLSLSACRPNGSELQMWEMSADSSGRSIELSSPIIATMPAGYSVLDGVYHGSDSRLLCLTSSLELWDLDLLQTGQAGEKLTPTELEEGARNGERSRVSRVLGNTTTAGKVGNPLHFYKPAVRTTPAQQAGLIPRLVEQVIPSHVPSHQLPPPSMIWSRFLAVYGVPAPDAVASKMLTEEDAGVAEGDGRDGATADGNTAGYLPPWLAGLDQSSLTSKSDFVDASWMDQLVQDALVKK